MSLYLNSINIGGYIAREPDVTPTKTGMPRAKFVVGLNSPNKDNADYIQCVAWGERAVRVEECIKKGQGVIVMGEISTTTWTDDKGTHRKSIEIVVDKFNVVNGKIGKERPGVATIKRPTPPIISE